MLGMTQKAFVAVAVSLAHGPATHGAVVYPGGPVSRGGLATDRWRERDAAVATFVAARDAPNSHSAGAAGPSALDFKQSISTRRGHGEGRTGGSDLADWPAVAYSVSIFRGTSIHANKRPEPIWPSFLEGIFASLRGPPRARDRFPGRGHRMTRQICRDTKDYQAPGPATGPIDQTAAGWTRQPRGESGDWQLGRMKFLAGLAVLAGLATVAALVVALSPLVHSRVTTDPGSINTIRSAR